MSMKTCIRGKSLKPTVIAGFVHTKIKCYTLFPVLGLTLIRNLVDKILWIFLNRFFFFAFTSLNFFTSYYYSYYHYYYFYYLVALVCFTPVLKAQTCMLILFCSFFLFSLPRGIVKPTQVFSFSHLSTLSWLIMKCAIQIKFSLPLSIYYIYFHHITKVVRGQK